METTREWHVPDALLSDYVGGRLDALRSASLEHHVERCDDCRRRVRRLGDDGLHEQGWVGVRARIEPPEFSLAVRTARRLGLGEPTAILLSAAASLRLAWLAGAFVALGFAVGAALVSGDSIWPFLLVAPLIPALGVAAAFGGPEEPTEILTVTAPYGRSRLVVVRTLAVVVATVPVACALGLLLPGPAWIAVAWLGPALAVLSVVLAIGGLAGMRTAVPARRPRLERDRPLQRARVRVPDLGRSRHRSRSSTARPSSSHSARSRSARSGIARSETHCEPPADTNRQVVRQHACASRRRPRVRRRRDRALGRTEQVRPPCCGSPRPRSLRIRARSIRGRNPTPATARWCRLGASWDTCRRTSAIHAT